MRVVSLFLLASIFSWFITPASAANKVVALDKVIAVVNDDVITALELQARLQNVLKQLQERSNRLPPMDVLQKQVLERMVVDRIQLQLAERAGIRIDDETVTRVIEDVARGNRLSLDEFRKTLQKDGFDFASFRESIRDELIITRLRKVQVENRIVVSEQEIQNFLEAQQRSKGNQNTEYHLGHILLALPEAATPEQLEQTQKKAEQVVAELKNGADFSETAIAVSNDELALKGGDLGWRSAAQLPSVFADQVDEMAQNDIRGPIRSASGFHIIKLLDRRSDEKRHIITQTMSRHILIRPNELISHVEARARLEALRQRISLGEDFSTLASSHSDDKGSAANGGNLGWTSPGDLVPEFQQEIDKLAPGQISAPFQSAYGWHIVQVLSRRQHDDTTAIQRNQAQQLIAKRKYEEEVQDWLRRLRAEAYVEYTANR